MMKHNIRTIEYMCAKPRKMRKLNVPAQIFHQDWKSISNKILTCNLTQNENDDSIICAIMQEPTHIVNVDGLSKSWIVSVETNTNKKIVNTITLPCSHCFHPPQTPVF